MKKLLMLGLAAAALTSWTGSSMAAGLPQVRSDMLIRVDDRDHDHDEWRDCHRWNRHRHECRDSDWDRNKWAEHEWYGRHVCDGSHDHYLDARGHWRHCR
jgi:hypothetical protein